jgi:hypothetical protein
MLIPLSDRHVEHTGRVEQSGQHDDVRKPPVGQMFGVRLRPLINA